MRSHQIIHGLAIMSLAIVAAMSIVGSLRRFPGAPAELAVAAPVFSLAIWSLLLWKILKRPRKWGFGVGIFLFLMIAFQTYLWRLAVANPKLDAHGASYGTVSFILYEVPIFVAGACCILLCFHYPNEPKDSTS